MYAVALYLSPEVSRNSGVNASVRPIEGYTLQHVWFRFKDGIFTQATNSAVRINNLYGGWELLPALNAAADRDEGLHKLSVTGYSGDLIRNSWNRDLYNNFEDHGDLLRSSNNGELYNHLKLSNPKHQIVSENRKKFQEELIYAERPKTKQTRRNLRDEFTSNLEYRLKKPGAEPYYEGSTNLEESHPDVAAARDSFNSLKNRGGKKKKKRTRKRRRVHVKGPYKKR
jgi:hypothetical protein